MFRENRARALVETIDDAIEQAEDLGLPFVAGILMMARLEAVQTEVATSAMRRSDQHH
jgi:zinc transporter ZupT